jgi:GNAT superfamily N-acetyltransferase
MPSPMTSSSAPSERFELGLYAPDQSAEAVALEQACPQGKSYRLSFRRGSFHRRAENFSSYRLVTARSGGRLIGIGGAAIKEVELFSVRTQAAFFFDLRVHPAWRRRGVGRAIGEALKEWSRPQAELAYLYLVADNRAMARLGLETGGRVLGSYRYLVFPTYRRRPGSPRVRAIDAREWHQEVKRGGSFDLYADPFSEGKADGVVGSWLAETGTGRAGCTAWSNREILAEVIEAVPLSVRAARAATRSWPLSTLRWPKLPAKGEELRSWYLFDFFATDGAAAVELMRSVTAEAIARGIDWCYLIHAPGASWLPAVRAEVPRAFAPVVPYVLGSVYSRPDRIERIDRLYVDIRDV